MNKKKVIVLGAGLIGKTIAIDLKKSCEVVSADVSQESLNILEKEHQISTLCFDFNDEQKFKETLASFDIVVCAVPGFMGFHTLSKIIKCGKSVVDISFFPENALELDELAKNHQVTAIVDCGVAPGLCNLIAGYHNKIKALTHYECLVGGLPKVREWPYEYKAVFSPIDVIEEYTRPARYVENGHLVTREALSDAELIDFDKLGTLESFNTDGLRSLALTMSHVPNMKEKTLRFPGHITLMKVLRETGFFDKNEIDINGQKIAPLSFTSSLLFPKWKMKKEEADFTVMRVTLENQNERFVYDLYDEKDEINQVTSMARTTAYTCTAAVQLLINNLYNKKGIIPPEYLGESVECFNSMISYLEDRNVRLNVKTIKK
ncbi:MAG: saccharopine dehydrogenase NADP-binding domain-containing protein [Flavobacteriia bacterium]|nr:saccharopine dehydrogenase NADP-binding domain-containing protein [Flavobacteriia bacterium]